MDIKRFLARIAHERLAGTAGERRARDTIVEQLTDWGVTHRTEPFSIHGFMPGTAAITAPGCRVQGHAVGLTESTVLTGRLVLSENPEALQHQRGAYRGCIVLTYGYSRRLSELVAYCGASAAVCIGGPDRRPACLAHRQHQYVQKTAAPMMTITHDDGLRLLDEIGHTVQVTIEQEVEPATATNIVATVGSPTIDQSLVYVTAHYDSVHSSEGATDNAAGVACALALLDEYRRAPPPRELRFVFFSGEELGLLGSQHHVTHNVEEIDERAALVLNIDISGDRIGTDFVHVSGTKELKGYAAGIIREAGYCFKETLSLYSSDGIPFVVREVPAVNLARSGGEASGYVHTPDDAVHRIANGNFATTTTAGKAILDRLLPAKVFPVDREIDESLREPLEKYLWALTAEKPQIAWTEKYKRPS